MLYCSTKLYQNSPSTWCVVSSAASLIRMYDSKVLFLFLETALGVKLDNCSNDDEYRKSIRVFDTCLNKRMSNPLLSIDFIYDLFEAHKYRKDMDVVHSFSSNIINKRRQMVEEELKNQPNGDAIDTKEFG